ncbi:cytochrome P450 [Deinococcus detaillensis]|uniref:Cytochrome P450 n=1 Tax=Deinococcus detaillensis TaxID=2592048 RepID=A0A553V4U0_9DEIO|nr:cytochrome P450 [Deinococcus detaillensis]TSA87487.1 cytochrome P450 [Deinococcus detaillensis]
MTQHPREGTCPFPHSSTPSAAPTAPLTRRQDQLSKTGASIELDERGVYRVHNFQAAREILRDEGVRQAGFMSEMASKMGAMKNAPVLFAEGDTHHAMRRDTARYFTPTSVATYQPMIAKLADELVAELSAKGEVNLDDLSLKLAVEVAAQVVGLTSSRLPGMEKRITSFVDGGGDSEPGSAQIRNRSQALSQQLNLGLFYFLDVKPAIEARKKERRDDLISHLLDKNYSDLEIMTECLTYGTAGMVTTREFISAAAWHLLQNADLRSEYLHGTEKERHAILHEILRLEPVVSTLYRRAEQDLEIDGVSVPKGSLLALNVQEANTDESTVGERPLEVCPARSLPRGVQAPVLAFGDGHHRCPGAFLAIRESDVFLRRLLIWNDLRIVTPPSVSYNEVVKGYELRGFRVALGKGTGQAASA